MSWTSPPQLVALAAFYGEARVNPQAIGDAAFLDAVTRAHWPTNCWSYAQASLAIISHACVLRPHLVRELIALPVAAMMAGGLDSATAIIEYGKVCAAMEPPHVEFTPEGRRWMQQQAAQGVLVIEQAVKGADRSLGQFGQVGHADFIETVLRQQLLAHLQQPLECLLAARLGGLGRIDHMRESDGDGFRHG